jgi:hypothetical protein
MTVPDSESIRAIALIWRGLDDGGWEPVVGELVAETSRFEFEAVATKKAVYLIASLDAQ